jgi:hypothetical protein
MTFTRAVPINNYGVSKFIVDGSNPANGTHSTITAALTSASSGDTIFIRPGTYTENLTLKAGVNLTAYDCDAYNNVIIAGKCTASFAGTCVISGIQLQTNADYCLEVSGASATIVRLVNCFVNCTDNTGINYTSTGGGNRIFLHYCTVNLGTTGIATYTMSSTGVITFLFCDLRNSAGSTTANANSAGTFVIDGGFHFQSFATSTDGAAVINNANISPTGNVTAITANATGGNAVAIQSSYINTGSASCVTIGAGGKCGIYQCSLESTNTNIITGSGEVVYANLACANTGLEINATTQTENYSLLGKWRAVGQPCVLAHRSSSVANATGAGVTYTILFNTEIFDQDSNYNPGTGTFTAPVTGKYLIQASCLLQNIGASHTDAALSIVTTARTFQVYQYVTPFAGRNNTMQISAICDMTATNTATITIQVAGSTQTVTVGGQATNPLTWLSVELLA